MRLAALATGALLAGAAPADAHPHVWITAQAVVIMDGGKVTAVSQRWGFDEIFSDFVKTEYDADGDGVFDGEETRAVAEGAFASLAEFGFLTHLRVGGEVRPAGGFRDFEVTLEGGRVVYDFTLPLERPVDPVAEPTTLGLYDDTFYIDVAFSAERPVTFTGGGERCSAELREDVEHPIYYGMVNPMVADIRCATS